METFWTILFMSIWDSKNFVFFREHVCPRYNNCSCLFLCRFVFVEIWIHICKINLRRWGLHNDQVPINKVEKSLDMNFISTKTTWNGISKTFRFSGKGMPNFFYVQGMVPELSYFQERESSNMNSPIVRESKGIIQY